MKENNDTKPVQFLVVRSQFLVALQIRKVQFHNWCYGPQMKQKETITHIESLKSFRIDIEGINFLSLSFCVFSFSIIVIIILQTL